ncbi:unnamed protein product, partial [Ilex paraguariensis]
AKKRRTTGNKVAQEYEPSGLDALATAAVLGDNVGDPGNHAGRFKTLMLRKKKRPSEREAEVAQGKDQHHPKDESETDVASGLALLHMNHSENERSPSGVQMQVAETSKGQLDLNSHPNRDEDMLAEPTGLSMTSLVHSPSHQLEMYLKPNGFGNFVSRLVSTAGGESECRPPDDGRQAAFASEQQDKGDER